MLLLNTGKGFSIPSHKFIVLPIDFYTLEKENNTDTEQSTVLIESSVCLSRSTCNKNG